MAPIFLSSSELATLVQNLNLNYKAYTNCGMKFALNDFRIELKCWVRIAPWTPHQ